MNKPAFPSTCKWCQSTPYMKQGRIWLCVKHYRFGQMRCNAKRHGKKVPTYSELENLLHGLYMFCCPLCSHTMKWTSKENKKRVITLQHNHNGSVQFLCRSCNTKHIHIPNDGIYELPDNQKYCSSCKEIKPYKEFYKNKQTSSGYASLCKECMNKNNSLWRKQNRETYNEYLRKYRHRSEN